jgi:hypothetical protein
MGAILMADKIIRIKRGLTAGNIPSALSFGELAVNTFDRTLFVGGITGGVQDYPLSKTYVYNTYTDFVADIDAGVYGTAGNESWFQYGDLFIERNTRYQYGFLPSSTGPTAVGVWTPLHPLTLTGAPELPPSSFAAGDPVTINQSYIQTGIAPIIQDGSLWLNTDTGILYTGYLGPSGDAQWVQAAIINNPANYS